MDMKKLTVWLMCGGLICAGGAWAAEQPSINRGQQLFTSKKLGTSGKSCNSCHEDGKGLTISLNAGDQQLSETINTCISRPLKGKPLDPESADMKSMVMYLKSLAGTGK